MKSLKIRLTILVSVELIVSVLIALGLDELFQLLFGGRWQIPLSIELIVITLLIGFFVTNALSKLFFDPIKKLGNAMEKVADGDFSIQLNEEANSKEIREIYLDFNMMVRELKSTEILQSDFVSNVSHEFKTPINAIEGYSMLLQGGDNLTQEQQEYVDKIVYNTKRLSSLTGSILLLSKLENQSIPTNQCKFRLDEQIRQSIVALEDAWTRKELEFNVELDSIEYWGNENLMHHVWDNLIGNAIKFSPQEEMISMELKRTEKEIIFRVSDRGVGISDEAKNHIFDKFYQADSSHKQEGNGLGLALVKKILVLEKGDIFVENNIDGGCTFTVKLKIK